MKAEQYTYRVMWSDEDGEYVATCLEFPSLSWLAKSQAAALNGLGTLIGDVIADMSTSGEAIPEPLGSKTYSGKLALRLPPALHRQLAIEAAEQGVSLNRHLNAKLGR